MKEHWKEGGNGKVEGMGIFLGELQSFNAEEMKLLTAKDLNLLSGIFLMREMSKFLAIG